MAEDGPSQQPTETGLPPAGASPPAEAPAEAPLIADEATARRNKHVRRLVSWLSIIVVAVLVAVLLRTYVVQTFFVPSGSMIPTLLPGDRILVQKLGYSITEGAVVVFKTPPGYKPSDCGGTPENDLV